MPRNTKHYGLHRWMGLGIALLLMTACLPTFPTGTPFPSSTTTQSSYPQPVPGQWTVYPDLELGEISPLVYGVNHGPWAFITDKTLPLAQEAGFTLIRFPGGNWGDENTLTPEQVDQAVALARQVGAEVMLNVRLFEGTPEQAAELVRYANIEQGYGIRYWGIGNEPSLYATARGVPDYGVERFNREWRAFAQAMRAVDPTILLIGPELHQFGPDLASTPKDPAGLDWMTEFLKANGDLVDVVSIHRYPFPQGRGGQAATIAELSRASAEWDTIIPYLRHLIQTTTGRDLPIAVTEVNSHWSNASGGEATPDAFYNAIWWADALGRMIQQRVALVAYFTLQSNPGIGGYGLLARSAPRPTYYVYRLYRQFGTRLVYSTHDRADTGLYAARRDDGSLTILLVNLGTEAITQPLDIQGLSSASAEVWRLDANTPAERIDAVTFIGPTPVTLPAQSVTLFVIKP